MPANCTGNEEREVLGSYVLDIHAKWFGYESLYNNDMALKIYRTEHVYI